MSTQFPDVKPFPGAQNQAAPIGHNKPPLSETVVIDFNSDMEAMTSKGSLSQRVELLKAAVERLPVCDNDDAAGRIAEYMKQCKSAAGMIDDLRKEHKRPILDAGKALDGRANGFIEALDDLTRRAKAPLDAYMKQKQQAAAEAARRQQEKERLEREEHARLAADNQAVDPLPPPAPAPAPVEKPVVRGDYGARVGTVTVWKHEIKSVRHLNDAILNHPTVLEALNKVVGQQVRGGIRNIKGVFIWSEEETRIR